MKSRTLQTKRIKDDSNFHEHFGHTLRCTTGGKVIGEDACILWIDVPHYFNNDGNSSNLTFILIMLITKTLKLVIVCAEFEIIIL